MAIYLQQTRNYFLKDRLNQLFVGAELATRWYQVIAEKSSSVRVDKAIAYATHAQGVCYVNMSRADPLLNIS